jgi:hypothetical protein
MMVWIKILSTTAPIQIIDYPKSFRLDLVDLDTISLQVNYLDNNGLEALQDYRNDPSL